MEEWSELSSGSRRAEPKHRSGPQCRAAPVTVTGGPYSSATGPVEGGAVPGGDVVRVQRVVMPDGAESWTVLDDAGEVVVPVETFLAHLQALDRLYWITPTPVSYFPIRRFSLPLRMVWLMLNLWFSSVVVDAFSAPSTI